MDSKLVHIKIHGKSGSGKSTIKNLIQMVLDNYVDDGGDIHFTIEEVFTPKEAQDEIRD